MYLLDTGIVAELRKAKSGRTDPGLAGWAAGVPRHSLFLSALSLLELENAAMRLERRDKAGGRALRAWVESQVLGAFEGRILPIDTPVVRRRAQLAYADSRDGLLAATALEHGLTLVTRNVASFKVGRVKLFNPWGYAPDAGAEEDGDWGEASRAGPLWLRNLFVRT
jgi:predicted nucleic acid-binding protein